MLTIEEIREELTKKKSSLRAVALAVGIHENALYRLVNNETKPYYSTVKAVSDYLESEKWK